MWVRKTVVLTTAARVAPSLSSRAAMLASAWRTSAATPPWTMAPSTMPSCPETASQSPARTTGVYGPRGFDRRLGEAGAAAAATGGVGVVDGEPGALEAVLVVERGTLQQRGAGRVDHDPDATVVGDVVVGSEGRV